MNGDLSEVAVVGVGSNLGDSVEIVQRALERLESLSDSPLLRSSLWRSSPVGCPAGSPEFVNAVAGFRARAEETPVSLLRRLQALEGEFGRQRSGVANEPRLLDLDLIAFGRVAVNQPGLVLPHPRAHLRRFVLEPLAEIAPGLVLPGQSESVAELLKHLQSGEILERIVSISRSQ